MRSDMIKMGIDRAPARGLLYATGQVKSAKDMQKPFIAICNSYIDIVPGHVHLLVIWAWMSWISWKKMPAQLVALALVCLLPIP